MPAKNRTHPTLPQRSRGQALIEFALVLPLLLLLIVGAMDLGRMFFAKIVITNAAREGANYIAYNYRKDLRIGENPEDNAKEVVKIEANSSLVDYNTLDIKVLDDELDDELPENIGVKVSTTVDLVFGNFLQSLGIVSGPMTLSSTVWMVVQ